MLTNRMSSQAYNLGVEDLPLQNMTLLCLTAILCKFCDSTAAIAGCLCGNGGQLNSHDIFLDRKALQISSPPISTLVMHSATLFPSLLSQYLSVWHHQMSSHYDLRKTRQAACKGMPHTSTGNV